ncbi:MAG: ATP synthase F0 subunit B [Myxococcota bacterium]|nr:ATP synthase F0 subunit B [Myxococcota bacterium]
MSSRITTRVALATLLLTLSWGLPAVADAEPTDVSSQATDSAEAGQSKPDEAHGAFDSGALIRHSFNLAVLLSLLAWFLRTPLKDFLSFRRSMVKEQLDEAWEAKTSAEARYAEFQGRLDNFDEEMTTLLGRAREDAQAEQERILAQAKNLEAQMETAAERTIAEELRRTQAELRSEVIDLALKMAEDALSQSVNKDDHDRLAKDYLSKMAERSQA